MKRIVCAGWAAVLLVSCGDGGAPVASPTRADAGGGRRKEAKPIERAGKLTEISLETLFPRQEGGTVLLYDARPVFISAFGKIPGAIPWPRADYDTHLTQREKEIRDALDDEKIVVIYCTDAACPDARAMAEKLAARGHDISILRGGFASWKDTGLPTE